MTAADANTEMQWFAMRDLSRRHAKYPAYRRLADMNFEVFTPMVNKVAVEKGRRIHKEVPFLMDLLFVHARRSDLDSAVGKIGTLQYRFVHGGYCLPMVVPDADMERFMHAVQSSQNPRYYALNEITPAMCGSKVRIVGGPLNGYEGSLLSVRGSKYKRLLVEIPGIVTVGVEVSPDIIEMI